MHFCIYSEPFIYAFPVFILFISAKFIKRYYGVFLPTSEMELEQLKFGREETHHSSAPSHHLPGPLSIYLALTPPPLPSTWALLYPL